MPVLPRVTVLGSLNTDISVTVPRLPGPGETMLGAAAVIGSGGKGANQAVAAARLGGSVRMAGCVGGDDFGRSLTAGLAAEGVDVSGVRAIPGVTSGLALISVDAAGENAITVAPGANALAGDQEVAAAFAAGCDVLVLSAEIPVATLAEALARARAAGVTTVLNLAPAPAGAAGLLAGGVDWLVVNVPEAAAVLGRPVTGPGPEAPGSASPGSAVPVSAVPGPGVPDDAWQAVTSLVAAGARHAVITLGAAGAVLAAAPDAVAAPPGGSRGPGGDAGAAGGGADEAGGDAGAAGEAAPRGWDGVPALVPGFAVTAVDSVGAGDAFVGALAVALSRGAGPVSAVRAACAAGAAAVTRPGAQAALPTVAGVRAVTGEECWPQFRDTGGGARPPGTPGR